MENLFHDAIIREIQSCSNIVTLSDLNKMCEDVSTANEDLKFHEEPGVEINPFEVALPIDNDPAEIDNTDMDTNSFYPHSFDQAEMHTQDFSTEILASADSSKVEAVGRLFNFNFFSHKGSLPINNDSAEMDTIDIDINSICPHSFAKAKMHIKEFSKEIPASVALSKVETEGGLFNLFSHKVTGDELNNLTSEIQNHIISVLNFQDKTVKEFGEIYNAFEALDKDYIKTILASVKMAEKSSREANEVAAQANKNTADIKTNIESIDRTINALVSFKAQINSYEHLKDIDEMWNNYQELKKSAKSLSGGLFKNNSKLLQALNEIDSLKAFENVDCIADLKEFVKMQSTVITVLSSKVKLSYILLAGSIGITLISSVLNILGVF